MEKGTDKIKSSTQKPVTAQTAQKETRTMNHKVREIKKLVEDGWLISDHDALILDTVGKTALKDLVNGHTIEIEFGGKKITVPTLSILKNKITLTHPKLTNSAGQKKTKSDHLWENEEWTKVLDEAGPMYLVRRANAKKGEYVLVDELLENPEDMAWVVRYPSGLPNEQVGYTIPSIGGFNFRTGKLENVPTTHTVIQKNELFHKWHDGQVRVDAAGASSKGKASGALAIHNRIAKEKKAGNTEQVKKLETLLDTMYPNS